MFHPRGGLVLGGFPAVGVGPGALEKGRDLPVLLHTTQQILQKEINGPYHCLPTESRYFYIKIIALPPIYTNHKWLHFQKCRKVKIIFYN